MKPSLRNLFMKKLTLARVVPTVPAAKQKNVTLTPPLLQSAYGVLGATDNVNLTWNAVPGAIDYLVYRIGISPSEETPPPGVLPANAAVLCAAPHAPSICTMLPRLKSQAMGPTGTALYGYPGAPYLLGRVSTTAYAETDPNTLQSLYFVIAEDNSGDLSSPSNTVGGPSFAVPLQ